MSKLPKLVTVLFLGVALGLAPIRVVIAPDGSVAIGVPLAHAKDGDDRDDEDDDRGDEGDDRDDEGDDRDDEGDDRDDEGDDRDDEGDDRDDEGDDEGDDRG